MTLREFVSILRDEVLTEMLGTYVHETDATLNLPAINVGADTPGGYTVDGLEAAVKRFPEVTPQPLLGDGHRVTREWVLYLRAWDASANLTDAVRAVIERWPQTPQPTYIPETDDSISEAILRVPEEDHWPRAAIGGDNA